MIKSCPYVAYHRLRTPAARELSVNPKKSWSLNFRLNLKIAHFRVRLYIRRLSSMISDLIFKFSKYRVNPTIDVMPEGNLAVGTLELRSIYKFFLV